MVLEQVVMELEVVQVDELAAITPRDVLRLFQFFTRDHGSAVAPAYEYGFIFCCACHLCTHLPTPV